MYRERYRYRARNESNPTKSSLPVRTPIIAVKVERGGARHYTILIGCDIMPYDVIESATMLKHYIL